MTRCAAWGVAATGTEEKLRYFGAMAAATDPALMKQTVAFATSGEVPNGRITMMIYQASSASGKAEALYKMVEPHEAEFAAKMPSDGLGPTVLVAAAAGSSDPKVADELLAAKSSQASIGSKIWAHRVADGINTAADLRVRAGAGDCGLVEAASELNIRKSWGDRAGPPQTPRLYLDLRRKSSSRAKGDKSTPDGSGIAAS